MEGRGLALGIIGSGLFVFVSSFLGLTGRFMAVDPAHGIAFMGAIWSASPVADAMFVAGSVAAAILAFGVAQRGPTIAAVLLGALANWLVYFASFLLIPLGSAGADVSRTGSLFETFVFVGAWGLVGLLFAALAPPLAALWWERRSAGIQVDGPSAE